MAGKKVLEGLRRSHLQGRRVVRGFTIDSKETRRRDDGFMVYKHDDGTWTAEVSIADVASVVPKSCDYNRIAMKQARDGGNNYLPKKLENRVLSLEAGRETPAVTYTVQLDQDFEIMDYKIEHTAFRPIKAMTYDNVAKRDGEQARLWQEFAEGLDNKRFAKRLDGFRRCFEQAGASTFVHKNFYKDYKAGVVEQMQYLVRRVSGEYLKARGEAAFYITNKPYVRVCDGTSKQKQALQDVLEKIIGTSYDSEDYSVDASSPIRRYDDLMMQRIIGSLIRGKPSPYTLEELEELRHLSRHDTSNAAGKLTLMFNEHSYTDKAERLVRKGDTSKLRPVPSNRKILSDIFARHSMPEPKIMMATLHHGATRMSMDIAVVVDNTDGQVLGMGLATKRNTAKNLAVRDAIYVARQKYCDAAPG